MHHDLRSRCLVEIPGGTKGMETLKTLKIEVICGFGKGARVIWNQYESI